MKDEAIRLALQAIEDGWLFDRIDNEVAPVLRQALRAPEREWKGLTDKEFKEFVRWAHADVIEDIVTKLKERNI